MILDSFSFLFYFLLLRGRVESVKNTEDGDGCDSYGSSILSGNVRHQTASRYGTLKIEIFGFWRTFSPRSSHIIIMLWICLMEWGRWAQY